MTIGRPTAPTKLRLTPEISVEIARRVRLRIDAAMHSSKAIAADYGVTESTIVGAIRRLRDRGYL